MYKLKNPWWHSAINFPNLNIDSTIFSSDGSLYICCSEHPEHKKMPCVFSAGQQQFRIQKKKLRLSMSRHCVKRQMKLEPQKETSLSELPREKIAQWSKCRSVEQKHYSTFTKMYSCKSRTLINLLIISVYKIGMSQELKLQYQDAKILKTWRFFYSTVGTRDAILRDLSGAAYIP